MASPVPTTASLVPSTEHASDVNALADMQFLIQVTPESHEYQNCPEQSGAEELVHRADTFVPSAESASDVNWPESGTSPEL
jgi:hypothetical protein